MAISTSSRTTAYCWVIVSVLWATLLVSYFDRVAIGAALPFMSRDLDLSPSVAGLVTGALFVTYTIVQVPAGILSDRFGQRRTIAFAIAWWTVFSILTGVVASSLALLLVVRFLMGAGEGFHPPPLWRMLANWFTPGRRSVPLALMLTALPLGPALAPLIAFPIISTWGWRWVFYATAVPGVLVVVLSLVLLRDTPHERDLRSTVATGRPGEGDIDRVGLRVGWPPGHIWMTFAAFFFFGFVLYGVMTWLPTYLLEYRHFDLTGAGFLASAPFLAGAVGLLVGAVVCEKYANQMRRQFIAVTYLLTAAAIVAVATSDSARVANGALIVAGFFLFSGLGPFWSVPMDIVLPHEVGTWLGFINMGTQISGFLGPIVIGALLQATGSFTPVLVAMVASMVLAALCLATVRTRTSVDAPPQKVAVR